jgi:Uma2 family endonuclease
MPPEAALDIALEEELETEVLDWEPTPPPTDLIFDDGEPLETNRHRTAMNVLIRSLQQAWSDRQDYFTGGNMFVYFSNERVFNKNFRGPDFFAVTDIDGSYARQGWVVWLENGRYPDVIVELMSSSTAKIDKTTKKNLYERTFRTPDYFVFSPFDPNSLQGWHLDANQHYQPLLPNEQGRLWCETLGFWLGTWEGTVEREQTIWLRFFDTDGNLVLLPEEAAQQNLDQAQQNLEQTQQNLDQAQEQANQAQQQAEQAQQQAEQQRQRAELLAAKLRSLGEDPDNL